MHLLDGIRELFNQDAALKNAAEAANQLVREREQGADALTYVETYTGRAVIPPDPSPEPAASD